MSIRASRRIAALWFAAFLSLTTTGISQTSSKAPQTSTPLKTNDHLNLTITVINKKGDFVTGLQRDNFLVSFDKEPAKIVDFSAADVPLSVGILVDVSASVADPGSKRAARKLITFLQQALKSFQGTSNKANEYFLLAFNNQPQLLLDWTSDVNPLIDALSVVQPKGTTALYDACYLALDKVQHGHNPKRVLLLISDGVDTNSTYYLNQVREALKESDVLLYSANLAGDLAAGSSLGFEGQQILNELSAISGGMSFYKQEGVRLKESDAASVFEIIATELGQQYSVVIQLPGSVNGKWHKIKIKVNSSAGVRGENKNLRVRTRQGFYLNHR